MRYRLSAHAREELDRRKIPEVFVGQVLANPEQVVPSTEGRHVYQSRIDFGGGRVYLLRLVVIEAVDPVLVVTAYRTSRITKYWSAE